MAQLDLGVVLLSTAYSSELVKGFLCELLFLLEKKWSSKIQ